MMKKNNINLCLFLLLPVIIFSQADDYLYKRKLNKTEKESFYSVPLLPEIVARSKSDLSDLRIYNFSEKDTTEIPYVLEWQGSKAEEKTISFERINDTYNEKCCSYLTLKINKQQTLNRIKLEISDANFDKSVKIEGSSDNKTWFTIKERLRIVSFHNGNEHFEYTTLDFPNTEYTYYRLKFDDDAGKPITVTNAYAFENLETPGNYNALKINSWKQTENKNAKTSDLFVEFPANYKVDHLTIKSATTKNFYRSMNVYRSGGIIHTAKGDTENWYLLNTSVFSSVGNNIVNCYNEQVQKLKIEILNYDDAPVEISELKAFAEQCHLITELPASDNLFLVYGKVNDRAPVYDLVHFKEKISGSVAEINYGTEQVVLRASQADNKLLKNKNWLWISMGAVILLIGLFSFRMLKKEQE